MRFILDNYLAPKLAKSLNVLVEPEHSVLHFKDRFAGTTPDRLWIRMLAGESDWVIVSGNTRVQRNPHVLQVWREAGHPIFFLRDGWASLPFWDQAQKLLRCFPAIIETAQNVTGVTMFALSSNGKKPVEIL